MRALMVAAALTLAGCTTPGLEHETVLSGETMGSAWTVKVEGELPVPAAQLRAGVQAQFDAVNQALSTYRPASALSVFNANDSGEWMDIDPELAEVMAYALSLAERSGGNYDLTVGPLVNLWGFGPDPATHRVPDAAAIAAARDRVGWRKVEVDVEHDRARKNAGVRVDLSSLGKGRGVDRVAAYLDAQGVSNYLIDLSGKLRAHGDHSVGVPWRVAVEQPGADNGGTRGLAVVALRETSVATAGDYRRYFEQNGRHYSHIIDPHTGFPVAHSTSSATAMAATCMEADALATVLMAMPPGSALRLADGAQIPALLIFRDGAGYGSTPSASWRAE